MQLKSDISISLKDVWNISFIDQFQQYIYVCSECSLFPLVKEKLLVFQEEVNPTDKMSFFIHTSKTDFVI